MSASTIPVRRPGAPRQVFLVRYDVTYGRALLASLRDALRPLREALRPLREAGPTTAALLT